MPVSGPLENRELDPSRADSLPTDGQASARKGATRAGYMRHRTPLNFLPKTRLDLRRLFNEKGNGEGRMLEDLDEGAFAGAGGSQP